MRQRDPSFSKHIIARNKVCQERGTDSNLQAHHNILISKGGSDDLGNGITLCANCHADRHPDVPRGLFIKHSKYTENIYMAISPELKAAITAEAERQRLAPSAMARHTLRRVYLADQVTVEQCADTPAPPEVK